MRFGQCHSLTPCSEHTSKLMLLLVRRFDPNQFCRGRRPFAFFPADAWFSSGVGNGNGGVRGARRGWRACPALALGQSLTSEFRR
jgi:hypothetical protein